MIVKEQSENMNCQNWLLDVAPIDQIGLNLRKEENKILGTA